MSERNDSNKWAWIVGAGVAAIAGAAVAAVAISNSRNEPVANDPVPRRQVRESIETNWASSSNKYDDDDALSSSSFGEVEGELQKCAICFRHLNRAKVEHLECQHNFHSDCIGKWVQVRKDCPMCRRPVTL